MDKRSRYSPVVEPLLPERPGNVQHIRSDRSSAHRFRDQIGTIDSKVSEQLCLGIEPAERRDGFIDIDRVSLVELQGLRRGFEDRQEWGSLADTWRRRLEEEQVRWRDTYHEGQIQPGRTGGQ